MDKNTTLHFKGKKYRYVGFGVPIEGVHKWFSWGTAVSDLHAMANEAPPRPDVRVCNGLASSHGKEFSHRFLIEEIQENYVVRLSYDELVQLETNARIEGNLPLVQSLIRRAQKVDDCDGC